MDGFELGRSEGSPAQMKTAAVCCTKHPLLYGADGVSDEYCDPVHVELTSLASSLPHVPAGPVGLHREWTV